jgi:hypothetical protein
MAKNAFTLTLARNQYLVYHHLALIVARTDSRIGLVVFVHHACSIVSQPP